MSPSAIAEATLIVFLWLVPCSCCKAGFWRLSNHVEVLLDGAAGFLAGA